MRRRLLWILLIGLALALIVMLAHQRPGHDRRPRRPTTSARSPTIWRWWCSSAARVLVLFRERLSQAIEAALFWVVVGFVLVFAYTYRAELRARRRTRAWPS